MEHVATSRRKRCLLVTSCGAKCRRLFFFYQCMSTKRGLPAVRINRQGLPQPWNPLCLMTATERRLHQAWQDKLAKYKETREITADSVFLFNLSQTEKFQPKTVPVEVWPALMRSARYFLCHGAHCEERFLHPYETLAMQCLPVVLDPGKDVSWLATELVETGHAPLTFPKYYSTGGSVIWDC